VGRISFQIVGKKIKQSYQRGSMLPVVVCLIIHHTVEAGRGGGSSADGSNDGSQGEELREPHDFGMQMDLLEVDERMRRRVGEERAKLAAAPAF
jgi:hypothetical protein